MQRGNVLTAPKLKKHSQTWLQKYILGHNSNWKSNLQLHQPWEPPDIPKPC